MTLTYLSEEEKNLFKERNIYVIKDETLSSVNKLGFTPNTISTGFTYKLFTQKDSKKNAKILLINNKCVELLLEEIKLWIWENYKIFISIQFKENIKYEYTVTKYDDKLNKIELLSRFGPISSINFTSYSTTLEDALLKTIIYILNHREDSDK